MALQTEIQCDLISLLSQCGSTIEINIIQRNNSIVLRTTVVYLHNSTRFWRLNVKVPIRSGIGLPAASECVSINRLNFSPVRRIKCNKVRERNKPKNHVNSETYEICTKICALIFHTTKRTCIARRYILHRA